jgi:hypothetical protein
LAVLAYFPVLFSQKVINPDAQNIFYLLENTSSFSNYITLLFSFGTMDFQPIRDLTFLLDLKIYQVFHYNFTILQNLIWWIASCFFAHKLLIRIFPQIQKIKIFFIILGFMVYPLFSQTVSWGVARKHILAFFFTILLTEIWIKKRLFFTFKEVFIICLFYTLSVLSQPIGILWPFWALLQLILFQPSLIKKSLKVLVPLFVIMISVIGVNYFYYELSSVFNTTNHSVTKNVFNFADSLLAFGHYVFQIFFPYLLSFRYTLGHWSTLVGLVLFGIFILVINGAKVNWRWSVSWLAFSFSPILMALINPSAQFDTYLLIPTFGVLVLCLSVLELRPGLIGRIGSVLFLITIVFWTGFTNYETRAWNDEISFMKKAFNRRPSCLSAADYLQISYENEQLGSVDAKKFIYNYSCEKFNYAGKRLIILHSYMLFYENDLPIEERLERLRKLSQMEFFPHTVLISLLIEKKMFPEAEIELNAFEGKWLNTTFKPEYIPIVAHTLAPYCRQNNRYICLKIINGFIQKLNPLFYK